MQTKKKFRLVTRSDLDGLVCAVLLKHLEMVDDILLVDSPSAMSGGQVEIGPDDITSNLPYVPGAHLCFDHHVSETLRNKPAQGYIMNPDAPSAARVIYDYYGGKNTFPSFFDEIMEAVDKADSGVFSREEILHPAGWPLLNFLVDGRTRVEEWGAFKVDQITFKKKLVDLMGKMSIEEIMSFPDVRERAEIYFKYGDKYKQQLMSTVRIYDNVAVIDFRECSWIYPGNRFIIYALYPQCNISIQIKQEKEGLVTTFSVGKSIINQTSDANIGELMYEYGGGGHRAAGACHVDNDQADRAFSEILGKLLEEKTVSLN